jgi:hypothetical protein
MVCTLVTVFVAIIGVILLCILGEAAIRQVPPPYQGWMWLVRLFAILVLIVIVASFFFGGGAEHLTVLKLC